MKQTEIGLIPDDWEVKSLEEVTFNIGDGIHTTPIYSDSGNFFFINGNNIKNGKIIFLEETKRVSENNAQKYIFPISDKTVLMSINGTIGNVAFYNKENIVLGKSAAYLTANNKLSKFYLFYILQSDLIKKQFNNILTGTTIQNLGLSTIRATLLPVPPIPEQQRIAKALSDADALISTTEQLLQKKKNIKQGAMQELLTGKKRLPGFGPQTKSPTYKQTELGLIPEDWEVKTLNELINDISDGPFGSNLKTEHYTTEREVRIIQLSNVGEDGWDNENVKYTTFTHAKEIQRCIVPYGSIVIAKMMPAGRSILCPNQEKMYILGSDCVRITPNSLLESLFFMYFSKTSFYLNQIKENTQGSTRARTSVSKLKRIEIALPSKEEQTAIANVLSSMDKEIETLNTKLEKNRNLKTAMMQQLLTGKIRLVK